MSGNKLSGSEGQLSDSKRSHAVRQLLFNCLTAKKSLGKNKQPDSQQQLSDS
jgi:hypothetical protein